MKKQTHYTKDASKLKTSIEFGTSRQYPTTNIIN